jgi:hypothetical protein
VEHDSLFYIEQPKDATIQNDHESAKERKHESNSRVGLFWDFRASFFRAFVFRVS